MDCYEEIYSGVQLEKIISEFTRLKDDCYLDHVGATLYSDVQLQNVFKNLTNTIYGNPHALNISSKFTGDAIDHIRYQVLDFFNTTSDEYSVIFTSGATAALKLVAESFDYRNGIFTYLEDNHTSVLGMREYSKYRILKQSEAFEIFNNENYESKSLENNSLFAYPAQCNFSGTKYPLIWIEKINNGALNPIQASNWYSLLDAASFVSTNKLDLKIYKADFVCVSFYKIFGYPTGLGALLVKNESAHLLRKKYFGGGTVQVTLPTEHVLRTGLHERFEDGTLPFLSILSLRHGFETLKRLNLSMELISEHTFKLAKYVHHNLIQLHHSNGNPVAILYHDTDFENLEHQGGIVNFNLIRENGDYIGYSEVLNLANLYKIHIRTGCFCNPGACQRHLGLTAEDVKHQFKSYSVGDTVYMVKWEDRGDNRMTFGLSMIILRSQKGSGHICGDQNDLIDGYPTGSVRISFGYMSTQKDADTLLNMIKDCFITKPIIKKLPQKWQMLQKEYKRKFNLKEYENTQNKIDAKANTVNIQNGVLKNIFLYPVKSCAAFAVSNWRIEQNGLKFDRAWMVITASGVCLTQKNETKLCLIRPSINLEEQVLKLEFLDYQSVTIPLYIEEKSKSEYSLCQSKVCGDRVQCFDCGDEVADWLNDCLLRSDLRLVRQSSSNSRSSKKGYSQLSLANQAQYLLLNIASVKDLASKIPEFETDEEKIYNLISRFRANFIIDTKTAFIENDCQNIEIGNFKFQCAGPCTRCQMICIDQQTSEKNIEPLRTLSIETKGKIKFGMYLTKANKEENTISLNEKVIFK